ncbi:RAD9, HUS1, RAD1-interacting nuclear orphan protein 1 [Chanos chanos]|uniref:RAD9, HUS1, RAD1-interacting nuclear orphan protein 1 n=1 Tax=Chanos chanos TaxID=29144 RepID=A0A6J2UZW4_CHACN|nr:RAD9, HUS1, RAD1-interacting nuclear orphan protein 1 [Chanos chanos]
MPRKTRKRCLLNPLKSQLLFVEPPFNGVRHDYGTPVRSAVHPRSFVSEDPRRGSTAVPTWVSPQFSQAEVTAPLRGGRLGRRNQHVINTLNTSSHLSLPQARKTTVCKYSPLAFETSTSVQICHGSHQYTRKCDSTIAVVQDDKHSQGHIQRKVPSSAREVQNAEKNKSALLSGEQIVESSVTLKGAPDTLASNPRSTTALRSPNTPRDRNQKSCVCSSRTPASQGSHTPDVSDAFTPPNIETPEMPQGYSSSVSILHLLWPPSQPKTPPCQSSKVLVKDTPERDYGLKVTWRRRKGLMRFLKERGLLLGTESQVHS